MTGTWYCFICKMPITTDAGYAQFHSLKWGHTIGWK